LKGFTNKQNFTVMKNVYYVRLESERPGMIVDEYLGYYKDRSSAVRQVTNRYKDTACPTIVTKLVAENVEEFNATEWKPAIEYR